MRIMVNIENAVALKSDVWSASVAPANVRNLSAPLSTAGVTSVVLVEGVEFDVAARCLSFPFGSVRVLNLGSSDDALFISGIDTAGDAGAKEAPVETQTDEGSSSEQVRLGFGDRDCLRGFAQMSPELQLAAQQAVEHIRKLDPSGDLQKEGQRYVNRPDNFVTLQPQPRVSDILVTFKGSVKTTLKEASARRPYQGFKIRGTGDVPEALRVLQLAKRRG